MEDITVDLVEPGKDARVHGQKLETNIAQALGIAREEIQPVMDQAPTIGEQINALIPDSLGTVQATLASASTERNAPSQRFGKMKLEKEQKTHPGLVVQWK